MAPKNLMVVEDEALVALDIKQRLIEMRYDVTAVCHSGLDAIEKATSLHPDLILMDINLRGDMDGIEAASRILSAYEVPIIYCSAYSDHALLQRAKITTPYGYVLKPFDDRELEITIDFALYKHDIEQQLLESGQRLDATLMSIDDAVIACDTDGKIFLFNPRAEQLTRRKKSDALAQNVDEILVVKQLDTGALKENFVSRRLTEESSTNNMRLFLIDADLAEIPIEFSASLIKNKKEVVTGLVIAFRDISVQLQYEQQIKHNAFYDALTELPSRTLFMERLESTFNRMLRSDADSFAVMFINLDRFRKLNEVLGHEIGDHILTITASRIAAVTRSSDTLSRFGGDSFALLTHINSVKEVLQTVRRVQEAITQPIELDSRNINITSTVGITFANRNYSRANEIVRDADTAMYRAKHKEKGGYLFFDPKMHDSAIQFLEWEEGMKEALDHNLFEIHYQPIIDVKTGGIFSVEALLRWEHHRFGNVSPTQFIPIAEESGLIVPIGEWVLRTALKQAKCWEKENLGAIQVGVNLSARQFEQTNLVDLIRDAIDESGIAPHLVDLEITEGTAMRDIEKTISILHEIHDLGVHISIDDFGTGYSSLSCLKRFPVNTLKIDRSFITDVTTNCDDQAITNAIIGLAKNMNLLVLAEGVETKEQWDYLTKNGCDLIQGFYYSRPLPVDQMTDLLRTFGQG